ncbi:MAG: TonB-dependent receptor [Flavobacteriales bacterium]|nr:TonB-dependent receptor [Flavobacteriales bacterium]MCB9448641.1 TonB-dependent receptor [Flavobacteriales bacterium]
MKKYFVLAMFTSMTLAGFAQQLTVLDQTSLQPVRDVVIYNNKPKLVFVVTDALGHTDVSVFKDADSIRFQHVGYRDAVYSYQALQGMDFLLKLTPAAYSMNQVVVSANRTYEIRKDVAQQMDVIQSSDIAFMNQASSADLMQATGHVAVQKSQLGGGSPIIRGFETNKVLIVVDGVRMNNAIYRGGHLQNIITLDQTMMDRVEIAYGPGAVAYGSDALGGVMHFITRKPLLASGDKTDVSAHVFSRYASASDERTVHADANIGGVKWASLTSLNFSRFGDLRQGGVRNPFYGDWGKRTFYVERVGDVDSVFKNPNPNIQKLSGYSQYDVMQKVLFKPTQRSEHQLNLQYSTSSDINRYDRLTQTQGGLPRYAQWYYGPQKRLLAAYTFVSMDTCKMMDNSTVTTAYQNIEESRNDRRLGRNDLRHRSEHLDIFSVNADFSKTMGKHKVLYGLEAFLNDVASVAETEDIVTGMMTPLDTRYPDGGSVMTSFAAYLTHSLELYPKLVVNEGVRFTHTRLHAAFDDTTFFPFPFHDVTQQYGALNGKVGVVYKPGHKWRLSLVASTGFRAPNVDDLSKVFESVPGTVIVPNPDLKAEHTYNIELGVTKQLGENLTAGVNGYYCWYADAITTRPGTFNGMDSVMYDGQMGAVLMNVNASEGYIYGGQAFVSADLSRNVSLSSELNYTYGRLRTDTTDYPLDHIPPVFGKTSVLVHLDRFKGECFAMYNGWKRLADYNLFGEDNIAYATVNGMPAWVTLNARVAYQISAAWQVQLSMENILDQNYRVFASNISAPGRNTFVTVRASF